MGRVEIVVRAVLAAARLGMVHRFTYRLEVAVAVVAALAVVVVNTSLWTAAADHGPVAGLGRATLGTYTVVAWLVAAAVGGRVEEQVAERFRTGAIAADLLRPLDLHAWVLARHAGRGAASLVLTAVPAFGVMALFFPLSLPAHPATWLGFALSVALAGAVGAQIGFLVGLAAFRLEQGAGLAHLKAALVLLLSGAVIPVAAFPDAVRPIVHWLPFQAIAHLPATVFLEQQLLGALLVQALWAVVLALACRLVLGRARSWLVVQGG